MRIYLAGPMRGKPQFNFPAFRVAAYELRRQGHDVFSPAERDEEVYGTGFAANNVTGDEAKSVKEHAFSLREALAADVKFICEEAQGIYMLKGWEKSYGARAEHALAVAIGLYVEYQ